MWDDMTITGNIHGGNKCV